MTKRCHACFLVCLTASNRGTRGGKDKEKTLSQADASPSSSTVKKTRTKKRTCPEWEGEEEDDEEIALKNIEVDLEDV